MTEPDQPSVETPTRSAFWWIAICGGLLLLTAIAVSRRPINHDSAWYLYMVGHWLDGGVPYRDAVDTNPPLIVLLTVPPVWAARLLGVSAIPMFQAYVFVLAVTSAVACGRSITRLRATRSPMDALLVAALVFLVLPFPKGDFGQREHLAVLGTLPYVLLAARRAVNASVSTLEAVLTGIVGALGFALKPHFLLAWIAVEGGLALQARHLGTLRHRQALAAVATLVAYALVVVVGFPQYLEVAERVRQVYGGTNSPAIRLLEMRELQLGALALAILALVRLPPRHLAAQLVVGTAAGSFLLASLLQMKGWGYHMLPPQVFLGLFFALTLSNLFASAPSLAQLVRGGARGTAIAAALCLTGMSAKYVIEAGHAVPNDMVTPLSRLVREHASGGAIAVLGMRTFIYPAFPLVNQTGVAWSLRHNGLWFLPGFYVQELQGPTSDVPFHAPAAMSRLEREFFDEIVGDLCARPPELLIVEAPVHHAPAGRRALDLVAYYGQDARFVLLFAGYHQIATVPPFLVFKSQVGASCEKGDSARRDPEREWDAHE